MSAAKAILESKVMTIHVQPSSFYCHTHVCMLVRMEVKQSIANVIRPALKAEAAALTVSS